jgi:hypothetical protein
LGLISAAMEPDEVTELSMANAIKLMHEYLRRSTRRSRRTGDCAAWR